MAFQDFPEFVGRVEPRDRIYNATYQHSCTSKRGIKRVSLKLPKRRTCPALVGAFHLYRPMLRRPSSCYPFFHECILWPIFFSQYSVAISPSFTSYNFFYRYTITNIAVYSCPMEFSPFSSCAIHLFRLFNVTFAQVLGIPLVFCVCSFFLKNMTGVRNTLEIDSSIEILYIIKVVLGGLIGYNEVMTSVVS